MATSTLRPLSTGEILDAGIKVVMRHWRPLTKAILLFVFPLAIISALATAAIDPDQLELSPENTSTTFGEEDAAELGGLAVTVVISMLMFLVVNIACFKVVCDAWLGATPDVGRSLRFGLRRSPAVLWLTIVWSFAIILPFLVIIPGIWLAIAWSLAIPVLLFERVGPLKALGRSFGLVKGRWWATFLIVLVCWLLVGILGSIVSVVPSVIAELFAPESAWANGIATVVGTTASGVILYPYYSAVLTILYFDQRVRKEGFDLQLLAEGLGVERDPDAPLPTPFEAGPVYTPEQRASAPYWPPPPGWVPPPPEPPVEPWSSPAGWSAPAPASAEPRPSPESDPAPVSLEKRKGKRADWLPPEAPRGPGGL